MRFGRFFLVTGFQFVFVLWLYRTMAPAAMAEELRSPAAIVGLILLFGIPLSLFEYLYHRYLLHSAVLPFLGAMHKEHMVHHGLTSVKAAVSPNSPDKLVAVQSEYSVEYVHQTHSMEFPFFALAVFYLVFLLFLGWPLKVLFPHSPIMFSLICCITIYYSAYEIWHAILHLPYDQCWKPFMEKRGFGKVVRRTYAFHLMHHWRPTANLAIVGLWGVASWDYLFGTHRRPVRLPLRGQAVNFSDASLGVPNWPIRQMDRWKAGCNRWSRKIDNRALAVIFRVIKRAPASQAKVEKRP